MPAPHFVLDASVTVGWAFEDQTSPYTESVLEALSQGRAFVPVIWPLEVSNALLVAERRGRLTKADTTRYLSLLRQLPIEIEGEIPDRIFAEVLHLAREQGLSSYDASYLDLAMRLDLPLATQDADLQQAAGRCGVAIFGKGVPK